MANLDELSTAARIRDAIHREAIKAIQEQVPTYRYATVTQIDPDIRRVMVQFAGDPDPIPAKMIGIQPKRVGQVVQVSGRSGDLFISGIVGESQYVDLTEGDLLAPTNLVADPWVGSLIVRWTAVDFAEKYELQVSEDSAFTIVIATYLTKFPGQSVLDLVAGTTYYLRVRVVNNAEGVSPWSATATGTPTEFPQTDLSDGSPPADSPEPVITAGLGFLMAEWLASANADLVTYDVHISTTSGFTPSATTLVGSTTGTFYFINRYYDASVLQPGTIYHVRLVARDADGEAGPGAQGSGTPLRLSLGDAGLVPVSGVTDGAVPDSSPDVDSITNGVGFLLARWTHIVNPDGVTYEVHISDQNDFAPGANTLVGETPSTWLFIRGVGPGLGGGPLVYGTTYYVKLWAKDPDGYAASPGLQGSGIALKVQGVDIGENTVTAEHMVAGTITAASAIIADAAIGTAKIQNLAVTNAKIADLSVGTAKIANLAVGTAQIADAAISTAKIGNLQVDTAKIATAAITNAKIGSLAVDTANIQSGAITNAKIGFAAVDTAEIANLAVTSAKIYSLVADKITTGTLTATISVSSGLIRTTGVREARMTPDGSPIGTASFQFGSTFGAAGGIFSPGSWTMRMAAEVSQLAFDSTRGVEFAYNTSVGDVFRPFNDGAILLGHASRRWEAVYAVNGTIQTSDMRAKKNVVVPDREKMVSFAKLIEPKMYHMNNESDDRPKHLGFDAGEIKVLADSLGIPFAGVYDPHDDPALIQGKKKGKSRVTDDGYDPDEVPNPDDVMMGLNYSEFIPILWEWVADIEARLPAAPSPGGAT